MTALGTGLHNFTREQYSAIDAVSSTFLKNMGKSPAYAMAAKNLPSTPSQILGQVKHLLALEPNKAAEEIAVWAEGDRKGKAWLAFKEEHASKIILKADEMEEAQEAAAAVRRHPRASQLLTDGAAEVSIEWEAEGVKAKSRLDWVAPTHLVDLKFTKDASPDGYPREAVKYGLPLQAAFYTDAVRAKTGRELPFYVVAVEGPGHVTVWRVRPDVIQLGRDTYKRLLRQFEWCKSQDEWPGYPEVELELSVPEYAFTKEYAND